MQNSGLDDSQAEIKVVGRNINNFRYADDTTLMAESEAELKSVLMRLKEVKEESGNAGLNINIKKQNKTLRLCHPVPPLHGK